MLEFQLAGVRTKTTDAVSRWFGFDYGLMANSRDAEHQLTVPATAVKLALTVPLAGYTGMSKNSVIWPSVTGQGLPEQDMTVELWALTPTAAAAVTLFITWATSSASAPLLYINGAYDQVDGKYWGICLIGGAWYQYNMDSTAINDGKWHHFAVTFSHEDGVIRGRLYVDGVLRKLRPRGSNVLFSLEYAQFDKSIFALKTTEFMTPNAAGNVTEFVVWKGIPGHIGKGKPTTGPIRDATQPQGQLYVTGSSTIFNVPIGVTTLYVDGIGGGGGGTVTTGGGAGTLVSAKLTVAPGDVLRIDPGTAGGGGSNGTSARVTLNGTLVFTANGGIVGANTGGGAALYPGGPVLGTGGRSGGTRGYYGEPGGVRILWGEGRPLPVRSAPDV